jgi:hypothetical protein
VPTAAGVTVVGRGGGEGVTGGAGGDVRDGENEVVRGITPAGPTGVRGAEVTGEQGERGMEGKGKLSKPPELTKRTGSVLGRPISSIGVKIPAVKPSASAEGEVGVSLSLSLPPSLPPSPLSLLLSLALSRSRSLSLTLSRSLSLSTSHLSLWFLLLLALSLFPLLPLRLDHK